MPELRSLKLREVGDRSRDLQKLKEHPSWELLRETFEERKNAENLRLARRLTAGGMDADPPNQRHLDFVRGFYAGAKWILDNPDLAAAALAKELRKEADA